MKPEKQRAFLKWAGGKYKLAPQITTICPSGERLVEPFVGAGSIFLNSNYKRYLLCDINQDLINLYQILKTDSERFIVEAKALFTDANNDADVYYQFRSEFNQSQSAWRRSLLFLYMNRFGYNGLCRYNKKGGFNVPFGRYKRPYFPEKELRAFAIKAQQAEFVCCSYQEALAMVETNDVVYCDPPYAPLPNSKSFTSYATSGFSLEDQAILARLCRETSHQKQVTVVLSNHDTELTRELYHGANLHVVDVQRNISQKGSGRNKVAELIACYGTSSESGKKR